MSTDTMRLHYTYLIAILVLIGAFYLLTTPTPDVSGGEKLAFLGAVVGGVILFVFNRESSVSAARATERAIEQGANSGLRETTLVARDVADDRPPGIPLVKHDG